MGVVRFVKVDGVQRAVQTGCPGGDPGRELPEAVKKAMGGEIEQGTGCLYHGGLYGGLLGNDRAGGT